MVDFSLCLIDAIRPTCHTNTNQQCMKWPNIMYLWLWRFAFSCFKVGVKQMWWCQNWLQILNSHTRSLLGRDKQRSPTKDVRFCSPYHCILAFSKPDCRTKLGHDSLIQNKVTWTASFEGDNMFIIHWMCTDMGRPINLPLSLKLCVCAAVWLQGYTCICVFVYKHVSSHFVICKFSVLHVLM